MINKLIWYRIIEIVVVVVLVTITIPIWQKFDTLISKANVTSLDSYNLNFNVEQNESDIITIINDYYINKNFKVYLMTDIKDNNDLLSVIINKKEYSIDKFYKKIERNKCIYTILDDYITNRYLTYEISLKFKDKNIEYDYIFEEKSIF